ncbi:MAG: Zn-dependent hydrolase [Myxococcota bacterium]
MKPIDAAAIARDLAALARFGALPSGGVTRLALTAEDAAARRWAADRLRGIGCDVRVDAIGNLRARRPGREPSAPAIWTGSHLDTVPEGGRYDGAAGVVAAIAAIEAFGRDATRAPIEVVAFLGEEGSRFPRGTLGSAVVAGDVSIDEAMALRDPSGVTLREALAAHGDAGSLPARVAPGEVGAYVELHVEQGGVLEGTGAEIGVVETIAGLTQLVVTVVGEANHAGATPMDRRRDALAAAAELVLAVEELPRGVDGYAVATVGNVVASPGAFNIIPGRVEVHVDMRASRPDALETLEHNVRHAATLVWSKRRTDVTVARRQHVAPGPMSPEVVAVIESACRDAGRRFLRMPSGAVHDALHMAVMAKTGMIFVPSIGGRSHCPAESTRVEDLAIGAEVLARTLLRLAA